MNLDTLSYRGNQEILKGSEDLLAVFCSDLAPASILLQLQDLAHHWRTNGQVIISGFQSQGENEILSVMLRGPQPVIMCMARGGISDMRLKPEWKAPMAEGRLLLISSFSDRVKRPSAQIAYQRNLVAAKLASQILVAHAQPDSKTEKLVEEILGWRKQVYTLNNRFNQNLVEMGISYFQE